MARNKIIAGLDVGTDSVKVLVAQKRGSEWEVLTCAQEPSFGLRKGAVVDIEKTAKCLQSLMAVAERNCGQRIGSVFVNIGGSHIYSAPSDGLISVSRADQIISQEDIDRVLQASRAINIPKNEEILDVFPREFIIDDQKGIKQPLGLMGVRLEAKVLLLCYFQSYFMNLTQAVLGVKLQIDDIVPSALAAARAVLTPQQKEIGAAVIDIGAATTSLAVFDEGDLIHFSVIPLGSSSITHDIAIGLKTEVSIAEQIKKQYGVCFADKNGKEGKSSENKNSAASEAQKKEMVKVIEVSDKNNSVSFTKKELAEIIEPRVSEILDLAQKELKKIGRQELLPGGIVLTGGGSKLLKMKELAKRQLKLPCETGAPFGVLGISEDPLWATAAGLVLGGIDLEAEEEGGILRELFEFFRRFFFKFKRISRVFIP